MPVAEKRAAEEVPDRAAKRPLTEPAGPEAAVAGHRPFLIERFYAKHEFTARYMLGSSDAESWTVKELLDLARSRGDTETGEKWADLALGYTESPGHPELRRLVAEMYGGPIGAEEVLCVVPVEGIFIAMSALLSPGDTVVAMAPAYQCLHEVALARGCTVKPWTARYTPGVGWAFSLDDLRALLDEAQAAGRPARMLVANFPHNPTSWMPTNDEHAEMIRLCAEHKAFLFSDEMYWASATNRGQGEEPLSSCRRYKRAISLSGLSKPFGMPGLRTGWLATQDAETMAKFRQMKDYTTICGPAPCEVLAIAALRHRGPLLQRANEIEVANRAFLKTFCAEFSHLFEWAPEPAVGLMAFVVLRGWAERMGAQAFCDWCVDTASCVWVPSDCFEMPRIPAVRVGLGRKNFPEALEHLATHLRAVGAGGPGRTAP